MAFYIGDDTIQTKVSSINGTAQRVDITGVVSRQVGIAQLRLMAKTQDVVFKLGDSTVTADNTYTSGDLPAGNTAMVAGAIEVFSIAPDVTHISVIREDGASTDGVLWIQASYGD